MLGAFTINLASPELSVSKWKFPRVEKPIVWGFWYKFHFIGFSIVLDSLMQFCEKNYLNKKYLHLDK